VKHSHSIKFKDIYTTTGMPEIYCSCTAEVLTVYLVLLFLALSAGIVAIGTEIPPMSIYRVLLPVLSRHGYPEAQLP